MGGDLRQILCQKLGHTCTGFVPQAGTTETKQEMEERFHFLFRPSTSTLKRCPPSLSSWCAHTLLKCQNMIEFSFGFQGRQSRIEVTLIFGI